MTEDTNHFDELREDEYDSWEQDGKEMLSLLIQKRADLEKSLEDVKAKIVRLERVFGEEKQKDRRPKIRPVLKRYLDNSRQEGVTVRDLVEAVAKELAVKKDAVDSALKRWMSAEAHLFVVEGGKVSLVGEQKSDD